MNKVDEFTTVQKVTEAICKGLKTFTHRGKAINLPTRQTTGTGYQQETYAMLKAQQLCECLD